MTGHVIEEIYQLLEVYPRENHGKLQVYCTAEHCGAILPCKHDHVILQSHFSADQSFQFEKSFILS